MATRNRYAEIMAQYAQSQPFSFFGYPQAYTGGYDVAQPQAAAPVTRYEEIMAQPAMGGGGNRGKPVDYNPEWTALSDAEQAAFYAESPFFSGLTQVGQNVFGVTGRGILQNKTVPDFVARQKLIAQGIDPATGRYQGGDRLGNPLASGGFVQAPGEAGRGMPAPTGGFVAVTPQQAAAEAAAVAQAAAQAAEAAPQPIVESRSGGGGGGSQRGGESVGGYSGAAASRAASGQFGMGPGTAGFNSGGDGYAKGGHVSMQRLQGPNPEGPDDGYAALKDGEFVINDKAVKKYGIELMQAINSGKISKGKLRGLLEM
jgi:hypothetical protein